MPEGRAVAGAAQGDGESRDEPTPTRWLDQPQHTVRTEVLPTFLPGLTRHQQADKWLTAEATHDRGPRGVVAAEILTRKFELLGARDTLATEASLRSLVRLEGGTCGRPAWLSALNYLVHHEDARPELPSEPDIEPESEDTPTAAASPMADAWDDDSVTPPTQTVATDGGDDPAECPECGVERRPDAIDGDALWWCGNCEELASREVDADLEVAA